MAFIIDVLRYDIKTAILPTLQIRLRARHQESTQGYYNMAHCDFYFGAGLSTAPYLTSAVALVSHRVANQTDFDFDINLTFSQEMLFRLEKLVSSQSDVLFTIHARLDFVNIDRQTDNVLHKGGWVSASCTLEVKMSDWLRISAAWGRDMVLVPMSPKTHEKLLETLKLDKHLKSVDELVDELLTLHGNRA